MWQWDNQTRKGWSCSVGLCCYGHMIVTLIKNTLIKWLETLWGVLPWKHWDTPQEMIHATVEAAHFFKFSTWGADVWNAFWSKTLHNYIKCLKQESLRAAPTWIYVTITHPHSFFTLHNVEKDTTFFSPPSPPLFICVTPTASRGHKPSVFAHVSFI